MIRNHNSSDYQLVNYNIVKVHLISIFFTVEAHINFVLITSITIWYTYKGSRYLMDVSCLQHLWSENSLWPK
jgi:hypothetical protein